MHMVLYIELVFFFKLHEMLFSFSLLLFFCSSQPSPSKIHYWGLKEVPLQWGDGVVVKCGSGLKQKGGAAKIPASTPSTYSLLVQEAASALLV